MKTSPLDGISIFLNKEEVPTKQKLKKVLASSNKIWDSIHDFVLDQYPEAKCEWNFPGKKYGWSYRMKDRRRAIIYFIPQDNQFQVAFVFGQKAINHIMDSDLNDTIKDKLKLAKKYAEGTGIRLDVIGNDLIENIKKLIVIKLAY